MDNPTKKPASSIPIEFPPDIKPIYSNMARIAHAPAEFILDFARFLPGDTKAVVQTRIISSPVALKLFVQALNENLSRYESTFGTINIPAGGHSLADSLFKPHQQPPEPPINPPDKEK